MTNDMELPHSIEQALARDGVQYRLGGEIGYGGFSRIYEFLDADRRPITTNGARLGECIKVINVSRGYQKNAFARIGEQKYFATMKREVFYADILKKAQCEHIVPFYDAWEKEIDGDTYYFIRMKRFAGNLSENIEKLHLFSETDAIVLGRHICESLIAMLKLDLVHRDVKPKNILYEEDKNGSRQYALGDFTTVRSIFEPASDDTLLFNSGAFTDSEWKTTYNTPQYDICALGLVLFWYCNKCPQDDAMRNVQGDSGGSPAHPQNGSEGLWRIIRKAITRKLGDRYKTPQEMQCDLLQLESQNIIERSKTKVYPMKIMPLDNQASSNVRNDSGIELMTEIFVADSKLQDKNTGTKILLTDESPRKERGNVRQGDPALGYQRYNVTERCMHRTGGTSTTINRLSCHSLSEAVVEKKKGVFKKYLKNILILLIVSIICSIIGILMGCVLPYKISRILVIVLSSSCLFVGAFASISSLCKHSIKDMVFWAAITLLHLLLLLGFSCFPNIISVPLNSIVQKTVLPEVQYYDKGLLGMYSTTGRCKWVAGEWIYEGEIKNNMFSGDGRKTYANGDVFEGQFENDRPNGQGTLVSADGSTFKGNFVDGQKNGQGCFVTADGQIQEGNYANNQMDGVFKITNPDGGTWEIEFAEGVEVMSR